jgi:hypothetical protein
VLVYHLTDYTFSSSNVWILLIPYLYYATTVRCVITHHKSVMPGFKSFCLIDGNASMSMKVKVIQFIIDLGQNSIVSPVLVTESGL